MGKILVVVVVVIAALYAYNTFQKRNVKQVAHDIKEKSVDITEKLKKDYRDVKENHSNNNNNNDKKK